MGEGGNGRENDEYSRRGYMCVFERESIFLSVIL